mgnify:CR=1 FL=1
MLLLEEGVFTQPYSISYSITLWLKRYWTQTNNQPISHINFLFYSLLILGSLLYWLSLGFSMASSRGSCRESCPSFLNSYKSPAQGLAMLKSRHIPSIWNRAIQSEFLTHRNVASASADTCSSDSSDSSDGSDISDSSDKKKKEKKYI